MAASCIQPVEQRDFLAGLDAIADRLAVLEADAAAFVEGEFCVNQVSVVVDEPPDAKRIGVADLLVRLQRHDDVAVGPITLLFISDEVRDERRCHEFVVGGAAAVVVAVLGVIPK
jgi:hypothetical protein